MKVLPCSCNGPDEIINCTREDCPGWCGDEELPANHTEPITFTPGVPTEDGWYTITTPNEQGRPFYETIYFLGGRVATERWGTGTILSHAKLPELGR